MSITAKASHTHVQHSSSSQRYARLPRARLVKALQPRSCTTASSLCAVIAATTRSTTPMAIAVFEVPVWPVLRQYEAANCPQTSSGRSERLHSPYCLPRACTAQCAVHRTPEQRLAIHYVPPPHAHRLHRARQPAACTPECAMCAAIAEVTWPMPQAADVSARPSAPPTWDRNSERVA